MWGDPIGELLILLYVAAKFLGLLALVLILKWLKIDHDRIKDITKDLADAFDEAAVRLLCRVHRVVAWLAGKIHRGRSKELADTIEASAVLLLCGVVFCCIADPFRIIIFVALVWCYWRISSRLSREPLTTPPASGTSKPTGQPHADSPMAQIGDVDQAATPPATHPDPDGASWYFEPGRIPQGPFSVESLLRMAEQGQIGPQTLVWRAGMPDFVPFSELDDLAFSAGQADDSLTGVPPSLSRPAPGDVAHPHVASRTSRLAITSLVLGIVHCFVIGSLLATIFGAAALDQIARSRGRLKGRVYAIAGLFLGVRQLVIAWRSFALWCSRGVDPWF
jgi:hypothetical protein